MHQHHRHAAMTNNQHPLLPQQGSIALTLIDQKN
jgi:hypothetical protein